MTLTTESKVTHALKIQPNSTTVHYYTYAHTHTHSDKDE